MKPKTEIKKVKIEVINEVTGLVEIQDAEVIETFYALACDCGKEGGEIRFTAEQVEMNSGTEALTAKINKEYAHMCHDCCCKGRTDATSVNYQKGCKTNTHA